MDFAHGICLGLLRAIAGICLGCVIYLICQKMKTVTFKRLRLIRIAATAAELLAVIFILMTSLNEKNGQVDFICVLLEALLLASEFSGLSLINNIAEKLPLGWVGNFTMALFLCHFTWIRVLVDLKPDWPVQTGLTVYFGAALLSAIGFVWAMKGIRRLTAWIKTLDKETRQLNV